MKSTNIEKATFIPLHSKPETKLTLEEFLKNGSILVRQTEPGTPLWFGLKENNNFAIFDLFYDEESRAKHFKGQVANTLKEKASELIEGGWENGVLRNIHNFDLISLNQFDRAKVLNSKVASLIIFNIKPEKAPQVETFLSNSAHLIDTTEPGTYLWVALKMNADTYAIFDTFSDTKAQQVHFTGKVAQALQENANDFIKGGWEKGIQANIRNFQIIASS